jgi:tripartite-type tricarboxylate transporter receptor subunit TctC
MPISRFVVELIAAAAMVIAAGAACGEDYPSKPIRMLTSEPGGGSDFVARLIAQGLSGIIGQRVVVDNRGIVAAEISARAQPDGYTLLLYGSPLWLSPFMRDNLPFDPVKDFAPITLAVSTPNIVAVHPSVPAKSIEELIAFARARPGELNYSSSSTGSTQHLGAELFKAMAGVNIVRVSYKGSGPALNAIIAGQVQLMFPSAGSVMQHVKSGRLRALAVTTAQPSVLVPGLPTVSASGLPGYESVSPFGIFAPAKCPAVLIARLNHELVRVLSSAETREKFFNAGVETVGSSPAQLAATMNSEMAKWGKLIRDAGIREQ